MMKRTEKINIGGVLFNVDEDAFALLNDYIGKLENWFKNKEGGKEVVHDIELRLSEIFTEKTRRGALIVTLAMVREAVSMMGQPEDFEAEESMSSHEVKVDQKATRRLYRDPFNAVLGGVCSGLAAYLNMELSLVRVIFAVLPFLSFGGIIIVYVVLWIALPVAVTPAQRLEMQGEPITVPNIEKKVSDGIHALREEVGDIRTRWFSRKRRTNTFLILLVVILLFVFKIIYC